jgi:hypothetical protein
VDIKGSLENLERGIEQVRQFLVAKELAQLEGTISWLRDRGRWLTSSDGSSANVAPVASELERVDRELRGTGYAMLRHMRDLEDALGGIAFGGAWFDAEPEAEAACRELAHLQSASRGLLMVAEAALLSALLRCGLDVGHAFANASLAWTEEQLQEHSSLWREWAHPSTLGCPS